jgi:hypothetical protein
MGGFVHPNAQASSTTSVLARQYMQPTNSMQQALPMVRTQPPYAALTPLEPSSAGFATCSLRLVLCNATSYATITSNEKLLLNGSHQR